MAPNDKIRLLQDISGLSQSELALKIGVTFAALNRWVNKKSIPRKSAVFKIDKLLEKYGVKVNNETRSVSAKKSAVEALQKKHRFILKKILTRQDLIDELSLQITYNSNAIEGSTLTKEETREVVFENLSLSRPTLNEQLEAKNHHKAFLFLLEHLKTGGAITETLAKVLHKIMLSGIRDDAGMYRRNPVRIVGSFVPTANYLRVPELIKKLFKKKIEGDKINFIARFHADFEKIHPFADGNGRTGRLILIGMLLKEDLVPAIITKKKRGEYYRALQKAQLDENYEPILEYILDSVLKGYRIITL